jgi:hypothetical protein
MKNQIWCNRCTRIKIEEASHYPYPEWLMHDSRIKNSEAARAETDSGLQPGFLQDRGICNYINL